jgi:uncharacterized protein YbjT (DUF2867 family)
MATDRYQRVLVTGASGFVGGHLALALEGAGYEVLRASRKPRNPSRPGERWVVLDVEQPETLRPALEGCRVAYFLVHQIASGADYPRREQRAALAFRRACHAAGVERIIYLGGPVSRDGEPSPHLASRQACGEILRAGPVPTFELRAAMIIGAGGLSWRMLRDLAERLPAMLLPRWLRHHSWPVAIDDVVTALLGAAELPLTDAGSYALAGPERVDHRGLIKRAAALLGRHPWLFDVPVLTPNLSSYWIAAVTRTKLQFAKELVRGITCDLEPTAPSLWPLLHDHQPLPIDEAMRRAIADVDDREAYGARMTALGRCRQTSATISAAPGIPSP